LRHGQVNTARVLGECTQELAEVCAQGAKEEVYELAEVQALAVASEGFSGEVVGEEEGDLVLGHAVGGEGGQEAEEVLRGASRLMA